VVLEQAAQIGEIGAGIQLGPNAFHAFDALGVGDKARNRAVFTDYMVMHDAIDEYQVGKIPTDENFRKRFGNPYAVIHRQDIHNSLLEGATETGKVEFFTNCRVESIEQGADSRHRHLRQRQDLHRPGPDRRRRRALGGARPVRQ
jgi:2-polyprenyl-6-methoxyphenol hydroxylase-like FAD-dependent oxidoreductase